MTSKPSGGNIYNRRVILGRRDASRAGCILDGRVARVNSNGVETAVPGDLQALTGDLLDIVRHVADLLAVFGETLRAGEVIITGSIVPPLWISASEDILYTLEPVDSLSVTLDAS
jgi:2-keto-4-pentenoate hydratase